MQVGGGEEAKEEGKRMPADCLWWSAVILQLHGRTSLGESAAELVHWLSSIEQLEGSTSSLFPC